MSRLTEIIDNHGQMDDLVALLKYYGVNAQFVAESLLESFEQLAQESKDGEAEEEIQIAPELLEDLNQFSARF